MACKTHSDDTHDHHAHGDAAHACCAKPEAPVAVTVKDPVCGMSVDPATTQHHAVHEGHDHYFCSAGCRTKFVADPQKYLGPKVEQAPAPEGTIFTCPMHPEIKQEGPGTCPICGMALEPLIATADSGPNHELIDMQRRLVVAVILALPLVVLDMGGHAGFFASISHFSQYIELALATPVVLWCGWPFFQRGWASVVMRNLNMFTLIALGTGIAWTYSVVAALAPDLFPDAFRNHMGLVPVYFEAAAVITALVLVGQVLELRARERTGGAIRALLNLAPKTARRIGTDGQEADIDLAEVVTGDSLRVRPGEQVPADGVITAGQGTIDQSMMTGEPVPVQLGEGEHVMAATLNRAGSFVMTAEKVGAETTLSRIVQLVAEAQRSRAPIQKLADQVAGWFVPLVLLAAVTSFAIWASVGPEPRFSFALVSAVAVLIIACPCALGLATPMSIMVGIGRGAGAGVLMRNADALQVMENVDTLLIDKTGTLTEGKPSLTGITVAEGFDEDDVLRLAASLERASEHPLADAIVKAAQARELSLVEGTHISTPSGKGVTGLIEGRQVVIGNKDFLMSQKIDVAVLATDADAQRQEGATAIFVGIDGKAAAILALSDKVKPGAASAVKALQAQGLHVIMATGDNATTAHAIAARLGIDDVRADALPEDKASIVKGLQADGHIVAMAGDGINDAPALAAADIGIAMGTGTDVAMESAGITLVKGDLNGIVAARKLSQATMRNIRMNLFFAFAYNAAGVPIAAGILYPTFGILLSPVVAAAAMALSSVSVIANALRLYRLKL
tara:strand:- start:6340 stop:8715 length:2376 start_codon:yes stop_codon:yes gene_type:complete